MRFSRWPSTTYSASNLIEAARGNGKGTISPCLGPPNNSTDSATAVTPLIALILAQTREIAVHGADAFAAPWEAGCRPACRGRPGGLPTPPTGAGDAGGSRACAPASPAAP